MRWQPILSGVLGLALLEATLSTSASAGRVGQLFDAVASVISHVLSPSVPAIPDLRGAKKAAAPTAAPAAAKQSSPTFPDDWSTSATSLLV
jgi:hypothetical protein